MWEDGGCAHAHDAPSFEGLGCAVSEVMVRSIWMDLCPEPWLRGWGRVRGVADTCTTCTTNLETVRQRDGGMDQPGATSGRCDFVLAPIPYTWTEGNQKKDSGLVC